MAVDEDSEKAGFKPLSEFTSDCGEGVK